MFIKITAEVVTLFISINLILQDHISFE